MSQHEHEHTHHHHDIDFKKAFTVTKEEGSQVKIVGEIPFAELEHERSSAIKALGAHIELDGFRKGHVPESILVKQIGEMNILAEVASKSICSKFGLDLVDVSFEDLISIDGIGEQMANSFLEFFRVNRQFVLKLFDILKPKVTIKEEAKDNPFKNKTVVITGTMSKSRDEIKIFLENLGAKVSSSVSKKTDFLIYGEDAGSKYDKAIELGVKILSEDEMNSIV